MKSLKRLSAIRAELVFYEKHRQTKGYKPIGADKATLRMIQWSV